jgi:hypothetical protein
MRITVQTSLCEIMTLHENTWVIPARYGERRRAGLGLALLSTVVIVGKGRLVVCGERLAFWWVNPMAGGGTRRVMWATAGQDFLGR